MKRNTIKENAAPWAKEWEIENINNFYNTGKAENIKSIDAASINGQLVGASIIYAEPVYIGENDISDLVLYLQDEKGNMKSLVISVKGNLYAEETLSIDLGNSKKPSSIKS